MPGAASPRTSLVDFECRLYDELSSGLGQAELELTAGRWFEQMAEHGPSHIVALATSEAELAATTLAVRSSDGRMTAFAASGGSSAEELGRIEKALLQQHIRGLVLYPSVLGFRLDEERLTPLFKLASSLRAPVLVRSGLPPAALRDRAGTRLDMLAANPLELAPIADRYPLIPFVVSAFGAGFFREVLMLGELCENVHLGTAASGAWLRTLPPETHLEDLFERALAVFGSDRLLFATGSGPAAPGWRSDLATLQREALGALALSPADRALILAGNAQRLLGL